MRRPAVFRLLRTVDASECARLHAQAFSPSWPAHDLRDQLARQDRVLTGAVLREPALAGFAASRVVAGEAELLTIVIDRAVRGSGLGTDLLGHHLSALGAARVTAVFLEVGASNVSARALYSRFGFVPVGARKNYYGGTTDRDALVLRLDL